MAKNLALIGILFFNAIAIAAPTDRIISVSGQCLKKVMPDRGSVTLVAEFTDKSSQVASKKAMETYENIRKAVGQLKLKDLEMQTSEYNVREITEPVKGHMVSRGVRASLGLQVSTSELSRIGEVMALSHQFQINRVEELSTFLSQEKIKSTQEACLTEAIKNAHDKAEKMAAAAQAKVGEVQSIDESATQEFQPMVRMAQARFQKNESSEAALAPGIESKPESITVNVAVKFLLK